ncbi:MAG: isoaspartyl peptidase/L-asparaginase [Candidatus Coatesbacteria bacterium]
MGSGRFAIAVHGGAGRLDRDMPASLRDAYLASLRIALRLGRTRLARDGSALDAVEAVVRLLEDDPLFNAGKGAAFTADGRHEFDASIMDGRTLACGAVAAVRTARNPVSLARLVMEKTPYVFLAGAGADRFAVAMKVERVPNRWFDTARRRRQLRQTRGTVGCVALDVRGHLAVATSTGGMTGKRWGRVGDSPVIGAGTWADDATCAVSCTGAGEEFIRRAAAHEVSALMRHRKMSIGAAARTVITKELKRGDGGLIAVSRSGEIALRYNTLGMFRGAADSRGRFDVAIWE